MPPAAAACSKAAATPKTRTPTTKGSHFARRNRLTKAIDWIAGSTFPSSRLVCNRESGVLYCHQCLPTVKTHLTARLQARESFGVESWETFFTVLILENHYEPYGNSIVGMVPGDCHGTGRARGTGRSPGRGRGRLPPAVRRQDARRLGRRSQVLAGRRRLHHRPDDQGESRALQHVSHLAGRQAGRLPTEDRVPHAQPGLCQLRRADPQLGRSQEMASQRLSARHGFRRQLHRHLLRREFPRHPGRPRREDGDRQGRQAQGRALRRRGRTGQVHQEPRLERVRHHRPGKPHHREDQRPPDVRTDR